MSFIVHRWLSRHTHHLHFTGSGFGGRPVPRRPRLAARWFRDADGKLTCRWQQISSD